MTDAVAEISLSTMWSKNKYHHMAEFAREARDFGFTQVELNTALSRARLEQLLSLADVRVSSVHSPCPVLTCSQGRPCTELSLSSLEEEIRQEAVCFATSTVDLAVSVEAPVVVVHAGTVEIDEELEGRLRRLYEAGPKSREACADTRASLVRERAAKAQAHLGATTRSLDEISAYSAQRGVMVALENRVNFREIPSWDEMAELLETFDARRVGYWHDVGHAEIQSRLGFTPHEEWFHRFSDRMVGVHLHDVRGIRDHFAPGCGSLDWTLLARNFPQGVIKVCEIGEWNPPEDARRTVPFLREGGLLG